MAKYNYKCTNPKCDRNGKVQVRTNVALSNCGSCGEVMTLDSFSKKADAKAAKPEKGTGKKAPAKAAQPKRERFVLDTSKDPKMPKAITGSRAERQDRKALVAKLFGKVQDTPFVPKKDGSFVVKVVADKKIGDTIMTVENWRKYVMDKLPKGSVEYISRNEGKFNTVWFQLPWASGEVGTKPDTDIKKGKSKKAPAKAGAEATEPATAGSNGHDEIPTTDEQLAGVIEAEAGEDEDDGEDEDAEV